jgi:hypothetical protein
MKKLIVAALLLLSCSLISGQTLHMKVLCREGLTPLEQWNCQTGGMLLKCRIEAETLHLQAAVAVAKGEKARDIRLNIPCIETCKMLAKPLYRDVERYLAPWPVAQAMNKDYYAQWQVAIEDLYIYEYGYPRLGKVKWQQQADVLRQIQKRIEVEIGH